jgi:hypothetical protein
VKPHEAAFIIIAIPLAFWLGAKITEVLSSLIVGMVV